MRKKNAFKYGIFIYMLLGDNHPNNENMIDSKTYHIFYDKKVTSPTRFLKKNLYHFIVWCIFCKISKNHKMQRASLFQHFGSKTGILNIFMELRSYV